MSDPGAVYLYLKDASVSCTYDGSDREDSPLPFPLSMDISDNREIVGVELLLPQAVQRITVDGETVWERPQ